LTIAWHSDFDPAFQREALGLLRDAVADGQASPGNLAYIEDRVAVASGQPQRDGTQIGCGPKARSGHPDRGQGRCRGPKIRAGLDPLADYLAEMTAICKQGPG